MGSDRLTLAIDATPLLGPRTGIGTFVENLLGHLDPTDVEVTAFSVTWRGRRLLHRAAPNGVRVVAPPLPARPLRTLWARLGGPPIEWFVGEADVVHGPNFVVPPARRAATVVSVADLTPVHWPELCTTPVRRYPELIQRAIDRGALVHAISDFVADEIREHFAIEPDRVATVHLGVARPTGTGGDPPPTDRPYVVATGTIEPRKNLPVLVAAFDRIAGAIDLDLVIAGPDGWGVDELDAAISSSPHRRRIHRLPWIDDASRQRLVAEAAVLAYPSRYEGFGLPPLEAMALDTPVVAARAGAVPEIVGGAAILVEPGDVDGLAAALHDVLSDEARRAELVAAGRLRAADFDWGDCAAGLTALYRRAASDRARPLRP